MDKRCGLPLALPLHAKKLYQGLPLPGGEKEAQACRAGGGFFPHSKVPPPKFSFFKKSLFRCIEQDLWRLPVSGMHSMICHTVPAGRLLAGPVWRTPFGRHFCCRFPALRFFVLNEGRRVERAFP